jgi:hypothetical protein
MPKMTVKNDFFSQETPFFSQAKIFRIFCQKNPRKFPNFATFCE